MTGDSSLGMLPDIFDSLEIDAVTRPFSGGGIVALGPPSVVNVPTADTVGLSLLALLLASLGAFRLRSS